MQQTVVALRLRHPNIVTVMGSSVDPPTRNLLLVTALLERGTLYDLLHNETVSLSTLHPLTHLLTVHSLMHSLAHALTYALAHAVRHFRVHHAQCNHPSIHPITHPSIHASTQSSHPSTRSIPPAIYTYAILAQVSARYIQSHSVSRLACSGLSS